MPTAVPRRVLASVGALALGVAGTLLATPALAAVTADPVPVSPAADTYVSDSTPTFSWAAGDGQYLFSHAVRVKDAGGTVRGSVVQFASPWTPWIPLSDGAYTWQVRGQDLSGTGAWSSDVPFVIDTKAPDLTLTAPTAGTFGGGEVTVVGTVADANPGTVTLTDNGTVVATDTTGGSTFSFSFTPASGPHTLVVTAVDKAGNSNAGSTASVLVSIDADAPSLALLAPSDGSYVKPGTPLAFRATASDANLLSWDAALDGVGVDSGVLVAGPVDFQTTVPTTAWADGSSHVFGFAASDEFGQAAALSATVTADAAPPVVTFSAPGADTTHAGILTVTGTVVDSGSGVAELELRVRAADSTGVCNGSTQRFDVVPGAGGAWSIGIDTTAFADGVYCVIAHAEDNVGNGNGQSTRLRGIEFDNTAPQVTILSPASFSAHRGTVTVTGTVSDGGSGVATLDVRVRAFEGSTGQCSGPSVKFSVVPAGDSSWSLDIDTTTFSEGVYCIIAHAEDNVGNGNGQSTRLRGVVFDNAAPVVTFLTPASGSAHAGVVTVSGTVVDTGSGLATLDLRVRAYEESTGLCSGPSQRFTVIAEPDGSWSIDIDSRAFPDGVYCVIAHAEDNVGNGNGQSTRLRGIEIDNTLPPAPQPVNPENGKVQRNDSPLLDWYPVAGAATYEVRTSTSPGRTPVDSTDAFVDNELNGTDATTVTGITGSQFQLPPQAQGWLWWQVRAIDAVGNVGPWSSIWATGVDTVAPTAALLTPADGATVTTSDFALTWEASEPGVSYDVQSSADPAVDVDGALTTLIDTLTGRTPAFLDLVGVPDGDYYWQVRATDAAGNVGPWTAPFLVTVDAEVEESQLPTGSLGDGGSAGRGTTTTAPQLTTFALTDSEGDGSEEGADEGSENDGSESDESAGAEPGDPQGSGATTPAGFDATLLWLFAAILLAVAAFLLLLFRWLRSRES